MNNLQRTRNNTNLLKTKIQKDPDLLPGDYDDRAGLFRWLMMLCLLAGVLPVSAHGLPKATSDTLYLYVAAPGTGPKDIIKDGSVKHPFASLEEARTAIRRLRAKFHGQLPEHGVTVRLRGGIYALPSGFALDASDSGTETGPLVFTAFPGEKVMISGGIRISATRVRPISTDDARRILSRNAVSHIREIDLRSLGITNYGVHGINGFRRPYANAAMELFINGRPYHLARYPDSTKIQLDTPDVISKGLTGAVNYPGSIRFDRNKLARWTHPGDMIAAGNFNFAWATDQLRIAKTDAEKGVVYFADSHPFGITGGQPWNQYFFYNLFEELDQPGEYYIDSAKGKLYFYPLKPLQATDSILVSMLEDALVSMKGASHVRWENIDFEAGRGMGFYLENTAYDQIRNCTIRNMGTVGVCIGTGSQPEREHRHPDPFNRNCPDEPLSGRIGSLHELLYENSSFNRQGGNHNGIIGCKIENTGCGGISLGGGDRKTLEPAGNYVDNCTFTDCGRIDYSYKCPVNIDGVGNIVRHCLFNGCPASAIYMHGNNHLIEYNIIQEACHFVDDMGAIYLGRDPSEFGNTIRWNYFKNIGHLGMTMAVYFDDGACGSSVYGNVFYKAGSRTVLVGGGSYNRIYNNIFIDSKMAFHLDDRLSNWSNNSLDSGGLFTLRLNQVNYNKPPYSTAYPELAAYFQNHPELPQHNDIENNILVRVARVHNGKAEWGPVHENNFITNEDPGFVDAAALDFSLRADAAVYKTLPGFKAIPFSEMGLRKK